jgi:hypothetical protein
MAKIEVTLDGKLADGRDKIEGNDDTVKLRDHGVELLRGNIDRDPVAPGQGRLFLTTVHRWERWG